MSRSRSERWGRIAFWLAAIVAAIGVWRTRTEQNRQTSGEEPPVYAATQTLPPPDEDPVSSALAGWVPDRPRTAVGRALATAWAAPVTVLGVILAITTGGTWRRDEEFGCWVVEGGTHGVMRFQRFLGFGANAAGHVVISRYAQTPPTLLAHEAVHVRQAERLGPLLLPAYALLLARWGYRDHPLERAARIGARRWTDEADAA